MSGRIVVMGSGELAPGLVATHRAGMESAETDEVVVIDTPYGFQENADQLTERIATFFETSLRASVVVASLRSEKDDELARERFLATIRAARYVFSGPGSPSYALRIWNEVAITPLLQDVVLGGGTVSFASAASLTLGRTTIPVYEIYKVGEAPRWLPGLDLMTGVGLPCTVVPHWNNAEGGNHDTSRCYVGERRFSGLRRALDVGVIGVDEHTAATIELGAGVITASGKGNVTLLGEDVTTLGAGESLSLARATAALGASGWQPAPATETNASPISLQEAVASGDADALLAGVLAAERASVDSVAGRDRFRSMLVDLVGATAEGIGDPSDRIAGFVDLLLTTRAQARDRGNYDLADFVRDGLVALGIEVQDTADGSLWSIRQDT